ncbi:PIN domain-containing protein [Chryseobacterium gregarium]|uniref:PIN domain-containing protein n=1 Tax=Chryseobacterium gregarium TaxID=456299 RepID=UPI0004867F78|nr:PIN domain-containing protein [Chryseobacterium gregarium]
MMLEKFLIAKNLDFTDAKYSLDTNILVYAYEESNYGISEIAISLITSKASISNYVYQEFLFQLKDKGIVKKNISKIGIDLLAILNLNKIDKDTYRYAHYLMTKHNFQLGDSIILADAILNDCNILYSQDNMGHHGLVDKKLKIINPFK